MGTAARGSAAARLGRAGSTGRPGTPTSRPAALALALGLLLFAAACSTLRPIEPGERPVELAPGDGLVVLHVRTDVPLDSIQVGGYRHATRLERGAHVLLLAGSPGRVRFQRIWSGPYYWNIREQSGTDWFEIRAGQVNYPGMLLVEQVGGGWFGPRLVLRFVNRSMIARTDLEQRYPGLLERFPIRYTGSGRDRFLEELDAARRAACAECAAEAAR